MSVNLLMNYMKKNLLCQQYNSYYKNNKGYNMTLGSMEHGYVHTKQLGIK